MRELSTEMRDLAIQTDKYIARKPGPTNRARAAVQLAALYAGRFIQVHPFINCNGRMSRMIANYVFHRYDYPMPYYRPYVRPGMGYDVASAACMAGNFIMMFQYLLMLLGAAISPA